MTNTQKAVSDFWEHATKTSEGMRILDYSIEDFVAIRVSFKTLRRALNKEGYKTKMINDILYAIPMNHSWSDYS